MENKNIPEIAGRLYQLAAGDINHVFTRSGLLGNKLSPFRYNPAQVGAGKPSLWFAELAEKPDFTSITRLLLEPDLKILFQHGGMHGEVNKAKEQFYIFFHKEDPHVLTLFFENREAFQILFFDDWESCLQWWTNKYSADSSSEYELVFRDKEEIETLVCALHCVDCYRRACLESMLDFQNNVDISIHTHDFIQLLKTTLTSADTRWLLPSLFELTPGLKNICLALKPEHLRSIAELEFVSCNQDLIMTMGERSKKMGNEFLVVRQEAIGWQASALIDDEERALSHVFLAPTAVANHLFSFETGANKESRFRHQALKRVDLIKTMMSWMEAIKELADVKKAAAAQGASDEEPQDLHPRDRVYPADSEQGIPQDEAPASAPPMTAGPDAAEAVPESAGFMPEEEADPETRAEEKSFQAEPEKAAEFRPEPEILSEPEMVPASELESEPVLQQQAKLWPQKNPEEEDVEPLTLLYHEPEPELPKKKCGLFSVLLIILFAIILGSLAFYWWTYNKGDYSKFIPFYPEDIKSAVLMTDMAGQRPLLF